VLRIATVLRSDLLGFTHLRGGVVLEILLLIMRLLLDSLLLLDSVKSSLVVLLIMAVCH